MIARVLRWLRACRRALVRWLRSARSRTTARRLETAECRLLAAEHQHRRDIEMWASIARVGSENASRALEHAAKWEHIAGEAMARGDELAREVQHVRSAEASLDATIVRAAKASGVMN